MATSQPTYNCGKCGLAFQGRQVICPHCDSIINYSDTVYNCGKCKKPFKGKKEKCPHCDTVVKYQSEAEIRAENTKRIQEEKIIQAKIAKKKKLEKLIVPGFMVVGILALIIGLSVGGGGSKKKKGCQDHEDYEAYSYAEKFVEERLKSPSSAIFPEMREYRNHIKTIERNKKFRITSWVESQNSFGAMIRTPFSCDIIFTKDCKVQGENIIIGD